MRDETKQQYQQAMGQDLGSLFYALYNEVAWVHAKWIEYRRLYDTSKERVDLLNDTAPFFFFVLADVFWCDILLHINRLTDPPEQGKKGKHEKYENLTLLRLPKAVTDQTLVSKLNNLIDQLKKRVESARYLRDKTIAHTEFHLAMKTGKADPLPRPERKQIAQMLSSFQDILNAVCEHYDQSPIDFELIDEPGGAESLLNQIKFAQVSYQQRMERFRTNRTIREDEEPLPQA